MNVHTLEISAESSGASFQRSNAIPGSAGAGAAGAGAGAGSLGEVLQSWFFVPYTSASTRGSDVY